MTRDDDPPEPQRSAIRPLDLDLLSIDELAARIAGLKEEIARCEAKIAAKQAQRAAADALFGSGGGPAS